MSEFSIKSDSVIKWIHLKKIKIFPNKKNFYEFLVHAKLQKLKKIQKNRPENPSQSIKFTSLVINSGNYQLKTSKNISNLASFDLNSSTNENLLAEDSKNSNLFIIKDPHFLRFEDVHEKKESFQYPLKKSYKLRDLNYFSFVKSPKNIKLTSSISKKVLFPPILRNHCISLTPNPLHKPKKLIVSDAIINTETLDEEKWLKSKYF